MSNNEQALDFSLKRQKNVVVDYQPAQSSSSEKQGSSSKSKHHKLEHAGATGKTPLDTSFASISSMNATLNNLASIVYSPTSATFPGSAISPPVVSLDPTLMPTTSLALSTLYRRRRRRYSIDEKEISSKKNANGSSIEKDDAYWERRRKNNQAAKRSRDARKIKEDEIALRAAFLEQENCKLKAEVAVLKNEMARLHCLLLNQMTP